MLCYYYVVVKFKQTYRKVMKNTGLLMTVLQVLNRSSFTVFVMEFHLFFQLYLLIHQCLLWLNIKW